MSVKLLQTFSNTTDTLWTCAWSSNGKFLAVSGGDKTIRLYSKNGSTGTEMTFTNELKGAHSKSIRSVSFCPRRMKLAAASFDGTVSIWSGMSGGGGKWTCSATLEGHENEVKAASWGVFFDENVGEREQVFLSTCGRDKTVWIWVMEEEEEGMSINRVDEDEDFECLAVLQEHEQDIKCLTWHPKRPLFLTGSYDESVLAFGPINSSLDDWICVGKVARDLKGTVWSLAFCPEGNKLAVALSTGKLILYTLPIDNNWTEFTQWTRKDVQIFENVPIQQTSATEEQNDSEGCCNESNSCSSTGNNHESDSESELLDGGGCCGGGEKMQTDSSCCSSNKKPRYLSLSIPAVELYNLSWNLSGNLLAIACSDHSIRIVDPDGQVLQIIEDAHQGEVNCAAWSPLEEDILASVGDDGKLKIWQIKI